MTGDQTLAPRTRRTAGPRHRRVALLVATVLAGTLGAACSDDGTDDPATTPAAAPTTAAPTTALPPADPAALVIAHRGASGLAPEHTFAAYDLAVEQGADFIEQDLQLTADGELVVLHDDTLDRTARGPAESCTGPVSSKTVAQLRQCEVGSWFNEAYPTLAEPGYEGLAIPTLAEVLARYGTDVRYYIETKSPEAQPGMEEALLTALDEAGLGAGAGGTEAAGGIGDAPVVIQSFSAASLRLVHDLRPDLPLVQLLSVGATFDAPSLDDVATYAVGIGPLSALVDGAVVAAAHERCLAVHPWTVDDPAETTRLLALGVDGLFTNLPEPVLQARADHPAPAPVCTPVRP